MIVQRIPMQLQKLITVVTVTATLIVGALAQAQVQTEVPPVVAGAKPASVESIRIHGTALENNRTGADVDRPALVYLPPSYGTDRTRRYPVVYALHGFGIDAAKWSQEIHVPQTIEGAFAKGAQEMIVVLTDASNAYGGSMYSSSSTTGDFEEYIAHDVVSYMDSHYRTIADRRARGLVGHSMGGYGAARIGMKRADVFGALYIMSPCCMSARAAGVNIELEKAAAALKSPAEATSLSFMFNAQLAVAAAWSPNPANPPLYLDLPSKDGVLQPAIVAKWAANAPLVFVDQYIGNLRKYRAIAMDVGDQDTLRVDAAKLHELMDAYRIANSFEIYNGTHTSAVAVRFQNFVLPFFAKNLASK